MIVRTSAGTHRNANAVPSAGERTVTPKNTLIKVMISISDASV
jgi:hypothetical protein